LSNPANSKQLKVKTSPASINISSLLCQTQTAN